MIFKCLKIYVQRNIFNDFFPMFIQKYGQNGFLCFFSKIYTKVSFSFYPTGFQCGIRCSL